MKYNARVYPCLGCINCACFVATHQASYDNMSKLKVELESIENERHYSKCSFIQPCSREVNTVVASKKVFYRSLDIYSEHSKVLECSQ